MLLSGEAREGFPELSFQLIWEGEWGGGGGRKRKQGRGQWEGRPLRIGETTGVKAQSGKDLIAEVFGRDRGQRSKQHLDPKALEGMWNLFFRL